MNSKDSNVKRTQDIGRRIELVSMDAHFHDITIALYRQDHAGRPEYLVHTYSGLEGACERIEFITRAMQVLGDFEQAGDLLHFNCGTAHQAAARRAFLEACKLPSDAALNPKPLTILDKRSSRNVAVESLGSGGYRVTADGPEDGKSERITSIVGGLKKLAEMTPAEGSQDRAVFPCGRSHDRLVGLILPRAINVRRSLREEEAALARGTLVAPSQQK